MAPPSLLRVQVGRVGETLKGKIYVTTVFAPIWSLILLEIPVEVLDPAHRPMEPRVGRHVGRLGVQEIVGDKPLKSFVAVCGDLISLTNQRLLRPSQQTRSSDSLSTRPISPRILRHYRFNCRRELST